ncbi:flagellar filament capping protein FliD [soil metagenome]
MATITSAGVGSGLDVESIVSQLMSIERKPIDDLTTKQTSYNTQLSAIGQITSALSSLQDASDALSTNAKMNVLTASVADMTIAAATVKTGAVTGSYQLEVTKLATSQKLISNSLGQAMTSLGSGAGSLTFEFGTTTVAGTSSTFAADATRTKTVNLTSSQMTPANIRDAVNAAKIGVTATLLTDSSGSRLVFTSTATGAAQSMRISASDPDGGNADATGLSALAYDPAAASGSGRNMTQTVAAADSQFSLDGVALSSPKNQVDGIIDGVTLTLAKTNVGDPTTITIGSDDSAITSSIDNFIKTYNSVNSLLRSLTAYNPTTKVAGALQGDSATRSVQTRMRALLTQGFGSDGSARMSEIGITLQTDGSLKRDTTKFEAAFAADRDKVVNLFTGNDDATKSLGKSLSSLIDDFTDSDGLMTSRKAGINSTLDRIASQKDSLETRMDSIEARYRKQYTALDTQISKLQGTSTYLTQQLAALAKSTS